ncbi:MAG: 50S ribosomal protein L9 [Rhodothermales bacterium]|nr:50S ribosomal protein L9 [Rhodothermales bacterium]
MKVILLQDVEKLGEEGEIVTVKAGYGRNYLIPQGIARLATDGVVKARREEIRQQARKRAQREADAVALKKQLEGTEVVVEARVGEENRIFGTVTPQQVALKLATQGFEIDRRQIELAEDIRVIGIYTAHVKLHTNVVADLKVRVIPEGGVAADAEPEPEATEEAEEA